MSAPAVTVVITCFNYGRYLPESIGSVLAQTFTDFELLVIDDGSTDDSVAVAQRLAATDPRVTVIAQENSGQPAIPRNRAVTRAQGTYIVSLDADDRLDPGMLAACVAVLDADPAVGLVYPRTQEFGDSDHLHPHLPYSVERLVTCNFLPCCTMYRREAWAAAGGYNTNCRGYEDWDLWLGIAGAGWSGRPAHDARWGYRKHGAGIYRESTGGDQALKAQVVVNRSLLFTDAQVAWAHGVLAGDADALAITAPLGHPPKLADPPRTGPLRVARDRAQRADWHVDVDGLAGPWPGRTLEHALDLVDRLGFTAVRAGDALVARKRATDPVVFPVPFFAGAPSAAERAAQLAATLEQLVVAQALRVPSQLDGRRLAHYVGVAADELPGTIERAQALTGAPGDVAAAEAVGVGRLAGVIAGESLLAGDAVAAARATALQDAARAAELAEARRVAVLAYADELVADPALLGAYGTAFSADDDVTLVILTQDVEPLLSAVAAAGLEGDGSPDLLAVTTAPQRVDAILSRREHAGLPRFDDASLAALQALVAA